MPYVPDPLLETTRPDPETLVMANLRLARAVAQSYCAGPRGAVDPEDAYSDALIALWEAARKHDPESTPFAPYACWLMRRRMTDGVRRRGGVRTVRGVLRNLAPVCVSLSTPVVDPSGVATTLANTIADPRAARPDADPEGDCLHVLRNLASQARRVLAAHFVHGRTYAEIGAEEGLSVARVQQIATASLARLRGEGRAASESPAGLMTAPVDPARLYTLPEAAALIPSPMPGRHVLVRQVRRWVSWGVVRVVRRPHPTQPRREVARIPGVEVLRLRDSLASERKRAA